ncbi:IS1634 family transposase, partial [Nesterenkonia muleiensis]|uniref:IS1634 family transposase n=1 Tax=Nesterenkonia muleiensis TaxID=2282648 RepID=UPI001300197B
MGLFVRKVRTGAKAKATTAVQLMRTSRGVQQVIQHFGSAADEASVALLVAEAERRKAEILGAQQQVFELPGLDVPAATGATDDGSAARMAGTVARVLYESLGGVYERIGFGAAVGSEVFKKLVIAGLVEPSSKLRAIGVLQSLGIEEVPSYSTIKRHLHRAQDENWRDAVCSAAYRFAASDGPISLCLYDATTLYFEADEEDTYRRPGYSKERKVDPQVVVGLLVDRTGFPLEIHSYPGNTAEATTIIPVLESFKSRHRIEDIVVVADAGMLSQANCEALDEAGYQFIIA